MRRGAQILIALRRAFANARRARAIVALRVEAHRLGLDLVPHGSAAAGKASSFPRATLTMTVSGTGEPQLIAGGVGVSSADIAAILSAAAPLLTAGSTGARQPPRRDRASRNARKLRTNRCRS